MTLEELYNELGTFKWIGADEGWDSAIATVRQKIREELEKDINEPGNAFGMTDEDIKNLYEDMSDAFKDVPSIIVNPDSYTTNKIKWAKCQVCGRDKKYSGGLLGGVMVCKYDCERKAGATFNVESVPCIFDAPEIQMSKVMGVSCSCPKCSPKC